MLEISVLLLAVIFLNFILFKNNNLIAGKLGLLDIPNNKRKKHKTPTPLNGGIFFFLNLVLVFTYDLFFNNANILAFFNLFNEKDFVIFFIVIFLILLLGIIDDKLSLKPITKTLISSVLFLSFLITIKEFQIYELRFEQGSIVVDLFELSLIFSVLCFLVLQICLNMYDGINLQSSIYYIVIITFFFSINLNIDFKIFYLITIIYLIFFIFYNYKGKIFMGDNGVYIFSFILSLIIIKTYQTSNDMKVEHILIFLFFPFFDMLRLFFLRIIQNKSPLEADRYHFHHIILDKYGLVRTNIILILPLIISILFLYFFDLGSSFVLFINFIFFILFFKLKNK